ncbi:MAG: RNase adapter RapZ [Oscillospiraceae bacterium]|nr:RNase adapter RapZ [Oscillospiraceae bacterium]
MEFVIVTGLSGAGKSVAIHAMEDIGFYCLDNIPPQLILPFYDLCEQSKDEFERVAVVTDIRGGERFSTLFASLDRLKQENKPYKILFLDAAQSVRINRYKETRRRHPLLDSTHCSLEEAVAKEEQLLKPVREIADYIIDSTHTSPTQMRQRIASLFLCDSSDALAVTCVSFGFKHGVPAEADLVFDVRCLPNPYYIPELKELTGLDDSVRDYVLQWDETKGLFARIVSLIDYSLPLYCNEGKSQLVIAIGCTGGHHRSVALTQLLYEHLLKNDIRVSVNHRDIHR